jgi:hypothetical protein
VRGMERPGRCYPAAVLVEPAIACFGRVSTGDCRDALAGIPAWPHERTSDEDGAAVKGVTLTVVGMCSVAGGGMRGEGRRLYAVWEREDGMNASYRRGRCPQSWCWR